MRKAACFMLCFALSFVFFACGKSENDLSKYNIEENLVRWAPPKEMLIEPIKQIEYDVSSDAILISPHYLHYFRDKIVVYDDNLRALAFFSDKLEFLRLQPLPADLKEEYIKETEADDKGHYLLTDKKLYYLRESELQIVYKSDLVLHRVAVNDNYIAIVEGKGKKAFVTILQASDGKVLHQHDLTEVECSQFLSEVTIDLIPILWDTHVWIDENKTAVAIGMTNNIILFNNNEKIDHLTIRNDYLTMASEENIKNMTDANGVSGYIRLINSMKASEIDNQIFILYTESSNDYCLCVDRNGSIKAVLLFCRGMFSVDTDINYHDGEYSFISILTDREGEHFLIKKNIFDSDSFE